MPGRSLPNYDHYLDKLKLYASACEITVEYKEEPGEGIYIPKRRTLRIDPNLEESSVIAIFLHELGHSLDDSLTQPKYEKKLDKAYNAMYRKEAGAKHRALIMECEQRAWGFARGLAKKLRIPLGKWFDREEEDALQSYREF